MSILSKPYTISKAAVSNGFNKTKETLKMTASETGKTLSNALNDVAKPTNDYVSHTVKNVPGYRKSDVVDTTVDDLKFK